MAFPPPPVDLTSPIAEDVKAASAANGAYPRFADIPPTAPTDIRPASAWTRNIYDTLRLRREQDALAALYPETDHNTEAFAAAERSKATPPPSPEIARAAATAESAKIVRERAKTPSSAP